MPHETLAINIEDLKAYGLEQQDNGTCPLNFRRMYYVDQHGLELLQEYFGNQLQLENNASDSSLRPSIYLARDTLEDIILYLLFGRLGYPYVFTTESSNCWTGLPDLETAQAYVPYGTVFHARESRQTH